VGDLGAWTCQGLLRCIVDEDTFLTRCLCPPRIISIFWSFSVVQSKMQKVWPTWTRDESSLKLCLLSNSVQSGYRKQGGKGKYYPASLISRFDSKECTTLTHSLNPLRSWWNLVHPLVPATWPYFEQCVSPRELLSSNAAIFVRLQVCWGLRLLRFPVVRQWCANCYCYFTFSLNSRSLSSACLSKMFIFLTRVTPTGWYIFSVVVAVVVFFFRYVISCVSYLIFFFGFLFADFRMDT